MAEIDNKIATTVLNFFICFLYPVESAASSQAQSYMRSVDATKLIR